MKRILTIAIPAALLALAGCGGDTCSSADAPLQNATGGRTCTLTAGAVATIQVALCGKCTDSSPSCQAEFTVNGLEVAPVVQQCQASASCGTSAQCALQSPVATCQVVVPSSPGQVNIIVGAAQVRDNLNIVSSGGDPSCTL